MEIIIVLAVIALIAVVWARDQANKKKTAEQEKEWPFGEKLPEGKIHVKVADVAPVAPSSSEDRVEAPAPVVEPAPVLTVDGHGDVQEVKPVKKAPAKKPAAAKKTPAKKKSV
jgi:hypothetical protein